MRNFWFVALLTGVAIYAADWPMPGGNPQHNGWAKGEGLIDKSNVGTLKLLYKFQADNQTVGLNALTSPIIDGNLITYRGFKEMLMFGASSDKVFSVDADLNKLLWESPLPGRANKSPSGADRIGCPGGLTAPVVMAGSSSASMHFAAEASRTPVAPGAPRVRPSPYFPPLSQSIYPLTPTTLTQLAALYAVGSNGDLHVLNSSTGGDLIPAMRFVPPNSKVTSLNIRENVVYATTGDNCDGYQNAIYALDLLSPGKTVSSFVLQWGGFSGTGGTSIGNDGTIYVQATFAPGDKAGHYHETIFALTPKELKVKDYFTPDGKSVDKKRSETPGITPLVFSSRGKELILAGGRNGRLYLLDAKSLGSGDHHTPLFATDEVAQASKNYDGSGFRGTFSSWLDVDSDTRWFYVPFSGPARLSAELEKANSKRSSGGIVAFKLVAQNNGPTLQAVWVSDDVLSPAPVVVANGIVFALSTGDSPRLAKKNGKPYSVLESQQLAKPAILHAFDGITGKELYSSGSTMPSNSHSGGVAVANGRVYVTANDNAVYCFGIKQGQMQLTEQ